MSIVVPEKACCRACGYRLRGLPTDVCPECGRAYDPADPSTFTADPVARRTRRRWQFGIGAGVVLLLLAAFFPRGLYHASMTLTCPDCGAGRVFHWWEPAAPRWIPMRYPGLSWPWWDVVPEAVEPCPGHRYNVSMSMRGSIMVGARGSVSPGVGDIGRINSVLATPEKAHDILKSLIHHNAISFDSVPIDEVETEADEGDGA